MTTDLAWAACLAVHLWLTLSFQQSLTCVHDLASHTCLFHASLKKSAHCPVQTPCAQKHVAPHASSCSISRLSTSKNKESETDGFFHGAPASCLRKVCLWDGTMPKALDFHVLPGTTPIRKTLVGVCSHVRLPHSSRKYAFLILRLFCAPTTTHSAQFSHPFLFSIPSIAVLWHSSICSTSVDIRE